MGVFITMLFMPLLLTAQDNQGKSANQNYPWKKQKLMVKFNPQWKVSKITPEKMLAASEDLSLEIVPWKTGGSTPKDITKKAMADMKSLGKNIVLNEQDRGVKRGYNQHLVFTQFKGKETLYYVLVGLKDTRSSRRMLARFHWKGNKGISAKMKKIYTIVDGFEKMTK